MMMRQRRVRLCLDLCAKGDLRNSTFDRFEKMAQPSVQPPVPILPERLLWHVFKELVDACLILRQGSPVEPVPGWKPMVHNDLHTSNVFLDDLQPEDISKNASICEFFHLPGLPAGWPICSGPESSWRTSEGCSTSST